MNEHITNTNRLTNKLMRSDLFEGILFIIAPLGCSLLTSQIIQIRLYYIIIHN